MTIKGTFEDGTPAPIYYMRLEETYKDQGLWMVRSTVLLWLFGFRRDKDGHWMEHVIAHPKLFKHWFLQKWFGINSFAEHKGMKN